MTAAREPRRPHLPYQPALDGVRGVAVAAVLLFHGGFSWMRGGFLGVSTFFTLSGFLIAMLLLTEWRTNGAISLRGFWGRRFRRLMPALFVTLAGVALFGATVASADQLDRLRGDGLATLGYVANWRFLLSGQSYGALFASPSPLLHAWSLAIEEQFYVVFPLLVAGVLRVSRGSRRVLGSVLAALTIASAAAMVLLHHPGADPSRVYYGTDTRVAEILAGAVLAVVLVGRGPVVSRVGRRVVAGVGAVGLVLVGATWVVASQSSGWLYEGGLAAYALASVAVVVGAVHAGPVRSILSLAPVRWLGRVSYGVYLFHWPIFLWLSPARTSLSTWPLFAVRLAVTLPLAALSFRLVEQPIRRGRRLTGRRPLIAVPAAAGALAAVLIAVTVNPPAPSILFSSEAVAAPAPTPKQAGRPLLLVTGDSVSLTVAAGIGQVQDRLGVTSATRGSLGCGLAQGSGKVRLGDGRIVTEGADCPQWPARWGVDVTSLRPDVVLLVLGAWDAADRELDGRWAHPCQPVFDTSYATRVQRAVRVLGSSGAPVVLTAVPYLRSDVVTPSRAEGDRRIDCLNAVFRSVARRAGAPIVDLARYVCPTRSTCRTKVGGVTLRPDGIHYDGPGGAVLARWLVPRVLSAAGLRAAATPQR